MYFINSEYFSTFKLSFWEYLERNKLIYVEKKKMRPVVQAESLSCVGLFYLAKPQNV